MPHLHPHCHSCAKETPCLLGSRYLISSCSPGLVLRALLRDFLQESLTEKSSRSQGLCYIKFFFFLKQPPPTPQTHSFLSFWKPFSGSASNSLSPPSHRSQIHSGRGSLGGPWRRSGLRGAAQMPPPRNQAAATQSKVSLWWREELWATLTHQSTQDFRRSVR